MTVHAVVIAVVCTAASLCTPAELRVWDGDSFIAAGVKYRIENIDTAEIGDSAHCAYEAEIAERAKSRLVALLGSGPVTITPSKLDKYRRTLARVTVSGRDVGERLVAEGLARPWDGRRHQWC